MGKQCPHTPHTWHAWSAASASTVLVGGGSAAPRCTRLLTPSPEPIPLPTLSTSATSGTPADAGRARFVRFLDIDQVRSAALLMPTPPVHGWRAALVGGCLSLLASSRMMLLPGVVVLLRHKTTLWSDSSSQPVMHEPGWAALRLEESSPVRRRLRPPLGGSTCAHDVHTHTHTRHQRGEQAGVGRGEVLKAGGQGD